MIYVLRYLLIVLYSGFWGALGCILGLVDRSGEAVVWVARGWIRWILWTCRVEVDSSGLESIDLARPYVLMTNHQSAFDIAALIATWPASWRFVAKRELVWIPLFGWAVGLGGTVFVDRQNRERAVASLRRAATRLRTGTTLIVFPEGTRSPSGELGEFKSGGFHLAIEGGAAIVPITVSGSHRITPKHSLRIESGRIHVHYGKPIATAQRSPEERNELKREVRDAIIAGFDAKLQAGA